VTSTDKSKSFIKNDNAGVKLSPSKSRAWEGTTGNTAERIKTENEMFYGTDIKIQD
jgi:hypothetical protein